MKQIKSSAVFYQACFSDTGDSAGGKLWDCYYEFCSEEHAAAWFSSYTEEHPFYLGHFQSDAIPEEFYLSECDQCHEIACCHVEEG